MILNKSEDDWALFLNSQKLYKKKLRSAQRKSWIDYCESIQNIPALARMNKALSRDEACRPEILRLPNGDLTNSVRETVEYLLTAHFPECTFIDANAENSTSNVDEAIVHPDRTPRWNIANSLITPEVVEWSVKSFSPFKSGGPDNLFPAELQHGYQLLKDYFFSLFRTCVQFGHVQKQWTRVKVVFIAKIRKSNHWDGIKVLERVIDRYIRDKCLSDSVICDMQHAYRIGKSCETAVHQLVTRVEQALDYKESLIGTFIDIEGAFDNTSYKYIRLACERYGIDPVISRWI